ncbi:CDGSH iron-sulfur domain-containing protein [Candidatus Palauibacter sp.]|uniref:CDGSH iron-sulfur domain-containing protein n=1 Tax=Candidatus Palauibacter sp. TaxID=3101350 RepID=UPI003AF2CEE3
MPGLTNPDGGEVCTVRCHGDGPLVAQGSLRVLEPGAEEGVVKPRAAFCRCGRSANKPYCDGAHKDTDFEASGPIDTSRSVAADATDDAGAEVVVTPHANGPYHFDGVVEISGEGHEGTVRFEKPWLCRCGASKNKPFCDGAHKEIGFEAEGL